MRIGFGPANVTEDEMKRFSVYPGGFCCGECPRIIQCPWRCCQCMAGSCCFCLLYAPILLFLWLLSRCHGCFCNCCCPVLIGDPPLRYKSDATDARCLSRHSRRFFGCWTLRLISTPPESRNFCWRCINHFVCCMASIDRAMNFIAYDSAWTREQRNDFGEYFPMFGTISIANYADGVELLAGVDTYREGTMLFGQNVNSVVAHQVKGTSSAFGVDVEDFDVRRGLFSVVLEDGLERLRRAFHGGDATANIPDTGEEILARLHEIADPNRDFDNDQEALRIVAQIMFYLLTGGMLNKKELQTVATERGELFGDYPHWLIGGYTLLYRHADCVYRMNRAVLRQPKYLERIVSYCRENDIDAVVGMNQISVFMSLAGTGLIRTGVKHILYLINRDPVKYLPLFNAHPMKFVTEALRVMPVAKEVVQLSSVERRFMSGGREAAVYPGDMIGVSIEGVNTSYDTYKTLDMSFNPEHVTDPTYEEDQRVSWGGVDGQLSIDDPAAGQPRSCPAHHWAHVVVCFLTDVYKPKLVDEEVTCCCG